MKFYWLITLCLASFCFCGCKKNEITRAGTVSYNIVNVIVGGNAVVLNQSPLDSVVNKGSKILTGPGGDHLYVSAYAYKNSALNYFGVDVNGADGDLFTLLLSGSAPNSVNAFFYKEINIPSYSSSSISVRFINLLQQGPAISVNIMGSTPGSEIAGLAYQGIGQFKTHLLVNTPAPCVFEIKDATNGVLLSTYTLIPVSGVSTYTLVWNGLIGGTGNQAPGILQVSGR
ncbi:hypothetical protein DBR11_04275 [Pedobacter sp. HMWF019]|uniref:hypothetical protein n=1 Tax=Pedobacter sp. HMWF019 TaxID=2056856 RepID=UPI000D3675CB|nr:hypothetical protein [Pedobacter sp. HMWF019]PTT02671.1 hypothetical protein DBR11_04275 [Pedobacter sp. HMWF019]